MKAATEHTEQQKGFSQFQSTPPVKAATIDEIQTEFNSLISIHAAREGGDADGLNRRTSREISIHAAREGGDGGSRHKVWDAYISIHAAREGGDKAQYRKEDIVCLFQSTPPVKAATVIKVFIDTFSGFQSTPPVKAATQH